MNHCQSASPSYRIKSTIIDLERPWEATPSRSGTTRSSLRQAGKDAVDVKASVGRRIDSYDDRGRPGSSWATRVAGWLSPHPSGGLQDSFLREEGDESCRCDTARYVKLSVCDGSSAFVGV